MKLFQAKTVGHQTVKDSGWYSMYKELTIIEGDPRQGKTTLLRTLQAINPAAGESNLDPFHDYPREVEKTGYRRRVIPGKKTGVFAIFICNGKTRRELTAIDPIFYETDRIEVGRRLDWSRWINFVEIAASSRWSEVAPDLDSLSGLLRSTMEAPELLEEYKTFRKTKPTARVKNELADQLNSWLDRVEPFLSDEGRKLLDRARFKVNRAERFKRARQVTADNLPGFIYFNDSMLITASSSRINRFLNLPPEVPLETNFSDKVGKQAESRLAELNNLINTILSGENVSLTLGNRDKGRTLLVVKDGRRPQPLEAAGADLVWLVSLLVHLCNTDDASLDQTVLLLDEPGTFWSPQQREQLAPVIRELATRTQVIVTCRPGSIEWGRIKANHFALTDQDGRSVLQENSVSD